MSYYLKHHGVKGQEWGVRRGPPYPIDRGGDVRIKKGTEFHSTMTSKKVKTDSSRALYLYDNADEEDTDAYKGELARYKYNNEGIKKLYDHTFITSEDLLLPSQKVKIQTFKELYESDFWFRYGVDEDRDAHESPEERVDRWRYDQLDKDSRYKLDRDYRLFVRGPNMNETSAQRKFIDELKKKGYNAMIDDNDAYNALSNNPLYVFSQSSVEHIGKSQKISKKEMNERATRSMERRDAHFDWDNAPFKVK